MTTLSQSNDYTLIHKPNSLSTAGNLASFFPTRCLISQTVTQVDDPKMKIHCTEFFICHLKFEQKK
ncbi:hypothetical protein VB10N_19360 [Vibrio sp. 10N]|nr:hypothetical protein VB10N_19360 [Vibrio sp. 10N]